MSSTVTYKYITQNEDIRTYIRNADAAVEAQGYTEHSFAHVTKVAETVEMILREMDVPERQIELGKVAAYLHDIGNVVNRIDHAQSGAVMAFRLLDNLNMPADEICTIISAIGNHDEHTAVPLNAVAAALIIADKTDVRRSRVRNVPEGYIEDIHDRVNYSVVESSIFFSEDRKALILELSLDTGISSVMEYFEIFMDRMLLCRRAAGFFGLEFRVRVNDTEVM